MKQNKYILSPFRFLKNIYENKKLNFKSNFLYVTLIVLQFGLEISMKPYD